MTDHEKLSLEVLDNEESGSRFALLVLKMLASTQKMTDGKYIGRGQRDAG